MACRGSSHKPHFADYQSLSVPISNIYLSNYRLPSLWPQPQSMCALLINGMDGSDSAMSGKKLVILL